MIDLPPTDQFRPQRAALATLVDIFDRLDAGERLSDQDHARAVAQLLAIKTALNSAHVRRGGRLLSVRRGKTPREHEILEKVRGPTEDRQPSG